MSNTIVVPYLASISIYPVKGLAPVPLEAVAVDAAGALAQDRAWALRDERGRWINGKNYAEIHKLRALAPYDLQSLPRQASELLGYAVELVERIPGGIPDDTEASGPTVVAQESYAAVAGWFDGMSPGEAALRFRANLEIAGVPAFWEDQLYPGRFQIGGVWLEAVNPCQRCIVPSRDALTGAPTPGFQKRFMQMREASLPPWAARRFFNHYYRLTVNTRIEPGQAGRMLRIGDTVTRAA